MHGMRIRYVYEVSRSGLTCVLFAHRLPCIACCRSVALTAYVVSSHVFTIDGEILGITKLKQTLGSDLSLAHGRSGVVCFSENKCG